MLYQLSYFRSCVTAAFSGKKKTAAWTVWFWAENETRTRDPNLGKVVLYQLSYFRNTNTLKFYDYNLSIASAKVLQFFYPANFFAIIF